VDNAAVTHGLGEGLAVFLKENLVGCACHLIHTAADTVKQPSVINELLVNIFDDLDKRRKRRGFSVKLWQYRLQQPCSAMF